MKRLIVFLVFMNFLLLGGGQYIHAETHQNTPIHSVNKKHCIKFTSQDQSTSIIEDVDIEEDCSGSDDHKDGLANKFFASHYSLLDQWYLTFSRQIIVDSYNHFEIFGSSCGQSNPIYITQRVLRI
ncbi:hypothetical protein [Flavobacterium piscis]|uniref:Secreted protein n=1 Tax=Flavobacterium piscis TaxID=1114874 RepID=A0ABU1YB06_9FLAO|nr:hypothetical protein [Flavobacterium piscis]MDR7211418.1 hypothetical protein [Flavobacterium piscis]